MATKEQAVREELQYGEEAGMLSDLAKMSPGVTVARCQEIVAGAEFTEGEVDQLFEALNLDDSALEDEPDPEAPSERDGVRSWVVEYVNGVEGPSLCLNMTSVSSGTRIAGPKAWGGGNVVRTWAVDIEGLFEALGFKHDEAAALAKAVEGFRKVNEEKYPALYPTS